MNLDDVNHANEILDGSFRSSSHSAGENNSDKNINNEQTDRAEASGHSLDSGLSTSRSVHLNSNSLDSACASHAFQNVNSNHNLSGTEHIPFVADFSNKFGQENSGGREGASGENHVLGESAYIFQQITQDLSTENRSDTRVEESAVVSSGLGVEASSLSFVNIPKQENQASSLKTSVIHYFFLDCFDMYCCSFE